MNRKRLYWKVGLSLMLGLGFGWWCAHQLPLLRGGVRFEPATSLREQMAQRHSVLPTRKQASEKPTVKSMKNAYLALRSWEAREAMVQQRIEELLPDEWEEALRILTTYRNATVDPDLLAQILKAGGDEAFRAAVATGAIGSAALGSALRISALTNKAMLVESYVRTARVSPKDLALFIARAASGEEADLASTVAAAAILVERYGASGLLSLAGDFVNASYLDLDEVDPDARRQAIRSLEPLAVTPYTQSVLAARQRMAGRGAYPTTADNPELVSRSEMRRHLSVETHGRLRADGHEATLKWALTEVPEVFREEIIGSVFHDATFDGDHLTPVVLALNANDAPSSLDLVSRAVALARKAQKKRASPENYEAVQRLAGDREDVAALLREIRRSGF